MSEKANFESPMLKGDKGKKFQNPKSVSGPLHSPQEKTNASESKGHKNGKG